MSCALQPPQPHWIFSSSNEAAEFGALRRLLDAELRFPDALLFDLDLHAEIDGVGAVRLLREAWELDVPAVIVTGRVDARGMVLLPQRCVLLAKPVGLDDIDAALRRIAASGDQGLVA